MVAEPTKAIEVFYSYAHEDEELRNELDKRLRSLVRGGLITLRYDRDISAGLIRESEILKYLDTASIILLLVSPDFMYLDYCNDEMKRAMERHEAGEARVIPVILRPTDLEDAPFSKIQALPRNGMPVIQWLNKDLAFMDIQKDIKKAIKELHASQIKDSGYFDETQSRVAPKSPIQPSETLRESYVPPDPEQAEREVDAKLENTATGRKITDFVQYAKNNKDNFIALNEERDNLLLAAQWAYEKNAWAEVHELWASLNDWLDSIGDWKNESQLTTWAIEANKQLERPAELSQVMGSYSTYLGLIGKSSEEKQYAEMSLEQARKSLDRKSIVLALTRLGQVLQDTIEESPEGHKLLQEAWDTSRGISEWDEGAFVAYLLGGSYNEQGDSAAALEWYEQSLQIAQRTRSLRYKAYAKTAIGNWMIEQDRLDEAYKYLQASQKLKKKLRNKYSTTITLRSLARLEDRRGNLSAAQELLTQAVSIYEEIGIYASLTRTLLETGDILMKDQKYADAIAHYSRAKEVCLKLDSIRERVITLRRLGSAYADQNQPDEALQAYNEYLQLLESSPTKDASEFGAIYKAIGDLYRSQRQLTKAQENYEQARTYHEQSLALSVELQEVSGTLSNLSELVDVTIAQSDYTAADNYLERLLALFEQRGERRERGEALYNAGVALYKRLEKEEPSVQVQEQYTLARTYHERSLNISEEVQGESYILFNLRKLVDVAIAQSDYTAANDYLERLIVLLRQPDDQKLIAGILHNVGATLYDRLEEEEPSAQVQEQYLRVRTYHERSLAISEALHDEPGVIVSLNELVDVSIAQGKYKAANDYLERLVALYGQRGEQQKIAVKLHNVGATLYDRLKKEEEPSAQVQEQYLRMRTYHERSLAISDALDDEQGSMVSLNELVAVAITQGDSRASDVYLERLAALYGKRGERREMERALQNVGMEWYDRNERGLAEKNLRWAMAIGEELPDNQNLYVTLFILAQIEIAKQRFEEAHVYLERCVDLAKAKEDQGVLAKSLILHADAAEMQNLSADAEKYLRDASAILEEQNSQEFDRLEVLARLERLVIQRKNPVDAQQLRQQFALIEKSFLQHTLDEQLFENSWALGNLYLAELSEPTQALELFKKAREMKPNDTSTLISLVQCYEMLGQSGTQKTNEIYLSLDTKFSKEVEHKFSPTALRRLAWTKYKMGNLDTALELAKLVPVLAKLVPVNNEFRDKARARLIVASIEYLKGNIAVAREEIARAIEDSQLDRDLIWDVKHDIVNVIRNRYPLIDVSQFCEMLSIPQNQPE